MVRHSVPRNSQSNPSKFKQFILAVLDRAIQAEDKPRDFRVLLSMSMFGQKRPAPSHMGELVEESSITCVSVPAACTVLLRDTAQDRCMHHDVVQDWPGGDTGVQGQHVT